MTIYRHTIPAPGFEKNPGVLPDNVSPDTMVQVQWACGWIDHHIYAVKQLRWTITGHDFDVGAIRAA